MSYVHNDHICTSCDQVGLIVVLQGGSTIKLNFHCITQGGNVLIISKQDVMQPTYIYHNFFCQKFSPPLDIWILIHPDRKYTVLATHNLFLFSEILGTILFHCGRKNPDNVDQFKILIFKTGQNLISNKKSKIIQCKVFL